MSHDAPAPLGRPDAGEEARSCSSPSAHSPHSTNTQPELITVASACEMALTPPGPLRGQHGGICRVQSPTFGRAPAAPGPPACTESCPGALTPAVGTSHLHSGAKPWHFPGLREANIPFQRNTALSLSPGPCPPSSVFIAQIPVTRKGLASLSANPSS